MQATCREYKHLDDEWKFNIDQIQVLEAENGNVFHETNSKRIPDSESSQEIDLQAIVSPMNGNLNSKNQMIALQQQNKQMFVPPQFCPQYGFGRPIIENLHRDCSSDYDQRRTSGAMNSYSQEDSKDEQIMFTGPIKITDIENVDVKLVPSPQFLAHVKKRSGNRKK